MYVKDTRKIQDKFASIAESLIEYNYLDEDVIFNIDNEIETSFDLDRFKELTKDYFAKAQEEKLDLTLERIVTTNYYVSNFVKKLPDLQSARSELCA